jgi:hypothetical protein
MTGTTDASVSEPRPLPGWLATYTRYALYGLVLGTALSLFAVFTNPTPDASFPWFSLPAAYRLPVTQPLIEHWPVSYTIGIWLWIAGFPALFLRGYQRFASRAVRPSTMLLAAPTLAMLAWTTYCRFFWPKLEPATWNAPAYTFVCWAYCSSYVPAWSDTAYAIAGLGVIALVLAIRRSRYLPVVEAAFGVLALPLGLPAVFDACRRSLPSEGV